MNTQINGYNVAFVVTSGDDTGSITFVNSRSGVQYRMDAIQFADGTVWTWSAMKKYTAVLGTNAKLQPNECES